MTTKGTDCQIVITLPKHSREGRLLLKIGLAVLRVVNDSWKKARSVDAKLK